ncbi:MAG TPA: acyltransferase [Cytophagales bacterium]|nr:acyltransferase [Cytophagales bacterium]
MQRDLNHRIDILDLFRFLAISMVMLAHYFSLFTQPNIQSNFYPYGNKYAEVTLFKYGYLGVELFFIISGFVIFMSLEKCGNLKVFILKRFIRLFPPILFCSVLTFVLVRLIDQYNYFPSFHRPLSYFLPSLTFTEPSLWEKVFGLKLGYIDGVYWSLAVEVKFYFLSAILFYYSRGNFVRNWTVLVGLALIFQVFFIQKAMSPDSLPGLSLLTQLVNFLLFPQYILLFTLGILFYHLYNKIKVRPYLIVAIAAYAIIQLFFVEMIKNDWVEKVFVIFFIGLFLIFIYWQSLLKPFSIAPFKQIGLASYPLYLLHQNLGIILILYVSNILGLTAYQEIVVIPVVLITLSISFLIHKKIELPASKVLSRMLFSKEQVSPVKILKKTG